MKYKIPQDRLDNIVFKYLDLNLKGLEKKKNYRGFGGIVFAYPNEDYAKLGFERGILYVNHEIINEITDNFGLKDDDSRELFGRWASNRFQIEVKSISKLYGVLYFELP